MRECILLLEEWKNYFYPGINQQNNLFRYVDLYFLILYFLIFDQLQGFTIFIFFTATKEKKSFTSINPISSFFNCPLLDKNPTISILFTLSFLPAAINNVDHFGFSGNTCCFRQFYLFCIA